MSAWPAVRALGQSPTTSGWARAKAAHCRVGAAVPTAARPGALAQGGDHGHRSPRRGGTQETGPAKTAQHQCSRAQRSTAPSSKGLEVPRLTRPRWPSRLPAELLLLLRQRPSHRPAGQPAAPHVLNHHLNSPGAPRSGCAGRRRPTLGSHRFEACPALRRGNRGSPQAVRTGTARGSEPRDRAPHAGARSAAGGAGAVALPREAMNCSRWLRNAGENFTAAVEQRGDPGNCSDTYTSTSHGS